jgi:predicted TIM-barrel fold metal-dependent hydrolase
MFGVDYPHFETIFPDVHDAVAQLLGDDRVSDETARKVLYENAAAVYGSDLDGPVFVLHASPKALNDFAFGFR